MGLSIKNAAVERLVNEIIGRTGESKTEAILRALEERAHTIRTKITGSTRRARLESFLVDDVWPSISPKQRGRRLTKREEERILGYGKDGV